MYIISELFFRIQTFLVETLTVYALRRKDVDDVVQLIVFLVFCEHQSTAQRLLVYDFGTERLSEYTVIEVTQRQTRAYAGVRGEQNGIGVLLKISDDLFTFLRRRASVYHIDVSVWVQCLEIIMQHLKIFRVMCEHD